ncbi:MAG: efflux RND transporter periplasmic adaptor subunit [Desulfobacter sp.]|nr:MAG: efflux RND transporter periplasmic adaptor subunit [Desulfobacter sp.]
MKRFLSGCICAAFLGGIYFYFTGQLQWPPALAQNQASSPEQDSAKKPSMPLAQVTVYTVKSQDLVFTKDLSGRTSAFQVAEIRPQVTGIIFKRLFNEGSFVEKGQQLYQIDPATYQAAYASAAARLKKAMADVKAVAPKVKRYTRLVKMGGVSGQQYDDALASLAQAEAGIAVAKANLATAKINLDYTKVISPISGRIGRSAVTKGALVTANQPTALAVVQNLDQIYVDVNQSSQDLIELRRHIKDRSAPPMAALFMGKETTPFGLQGQILFSDVTVDQGTGMVQLRILFPNPEKELLPGLFVRARVEQSRHGNAITIPQQSVVRRADGSVSAWVVDSTDTVMPREIKVSKVVGDQWLVTSGLAPGDRVVVEGLQKIRPQAKVATVEMTSAKS